MIKIFKGLVLLLTVALGAVGCDAMRSVSSTNNTSQGAPYELIVVCNQAQWESALGDTLRSVLSAPVPYLNQQEAIFDVYRVPVQGYKDLIAKHRNILEVNISPSVTEPSIAVRYDLTATPQIVLTLQAPTEAAAVEYVDMHRQSLVKGFQIAERERAVKFAERYSVAAIDKTIFEKFGVEMKIPEGFNIRTQSEDMLWLSHEYPIASQGVVIYSYAAQSGIKSLSEENLVKARNKFVARIPGPSEGSYMTTFVEVPQIYRALRIEGRLWIEMRGLWDVVNDFMGGPYVSYSTIDERTNSVFTIDCYVYSPKYGKRNYLHTLEHLVYNVVIPQ